MLLVVYRSFRTGGVNAKNGMNLSHAFSQTWTDLGYLFPSGLALNSDSASNAASEFGAEYTLRSSFATAPWSFRATGRSALRRRWTTQVCTVAAGNAEWIASSKPASPSQQAMMMSRTPRLRRSADPEAQNRADSPAVASSSGVLAIQMPSTCLSPSASTPSPI